MDTASRREAAGFKSKEIDPVQQIAYTEA